MSVGPRGSAVGYIHDQGPDGEAIVETFTCCHCNRPTPSTRDNPICMACFKRVCEHCHADGRCRPFERRLEAFEQRFRRAQSRGAFLRSIGLE